MFKSGSVFAGLAALAMAGGSPALADYGPAAPRTGNRYQPHRSHNHYPGHVLREIRASTKRQARECARRRRQLGLSA